MEHESILSLGIGGDEEFDILGPDKIKPQQEMRMLIRTTDGSTHEVKLFSRIDTAIEVDYYLHGGILQYVLRELMKES
jgi:aconitate hydratase